MACCKLSQRCSFVSMISLTASLFIVEIVVGYVTNSMALVADSFHMLSDVVSLFVGYIALRFSKVATQVGPYTFGWARAEVLGALANAIFLVALCFSIFVEALKRIAIPEQLSNPKLVLIAGGIGLLVNIVGLFLFHGHGHSHGGHGHSHGHGGHHVEESKTEGKVSVTETVGQVDVLDTTASLPLISKDCGNQTVCLTSITEGKLVNNGDAKSVEIAEHDLNVKDNISSPSSLNIRGVYLHVLGDALGSVIVMVSALIILYTKGEWTKYVDPSLSMIIVLIILKTSFPLLKESSMILMQTVPSHIKIKDIQERLLKCIPGILDVHELHIWQLAGNRIIASAHVRCKSQLDYMSIASQVKEFFHNEGIHSTTIQPEFIEAVPKGSLECLLKCGEVCAQRTCCGVATSHSIV